MKGYTLIEVLLSIAIMAMVAAISVPIFQSALFRNQVDDSAFAVARSIRTAQAFAQAEKFDANWGIAVVANNIFLYKGNSYATRDSAYDQKYFLYNVQLGGLSEVNFSKLYGLPSSGGSITISGQSNTKTITINAKGNVSF